ncbi:MAG: hypothetical protein KC561_08040, partial [Myxococcales bacterium]|nr:hypothetical protein [Myxococcales bacterium]
MRKETEVFGITYDRIRLDRTFEYLTKKYPIRTALELPAGGAKAMPSIYSLGLARHGVEVSLYNPDPKGLEVWDRLGLKYNVIEGDDPRDTGLDDGAFDLVWNFVTVGIEPDFDRVIAEMSRLCSKYVMTVHCNGYNYGYPWHRFLHWALKLDWTHGETAYFFPKNVRATYRDSGLQPIDFGLFDMPWWPDPPGFRDVRLHLQGGDLHTQTGEDSNDDIDWSAP